METDSNFSAPGGKRSPKTKLSTSADRVPTGETVFIQWPGLQEIISKLPESRPDAVALARELIADPGYPSGEILERVAWHLAARLASGCDSLPS